jgi:hypothetical protein
MHATGGLIGGVLLKDALGGVYHFYRMLFSLISSVRRDR